MLKKSKGILALTLAIFSSFMLFACGNDPMDKKLTKENYNAIVVDTSTYDDVVELFGEPASDQKLTDGDGTIVWKNKKETKTVSITFENNVVKNKTQTGLLDDQQE